ncbi:MAG TPA: phosphate-starvation-inducible PsiE family protein, partial [Acetobacteraceae bacterium]|nr:phosphate-starvation-inducible PsiE family protein [Acetobacteraceae bacterium]
MTQESSSSEDSFIPRRPFLVVEHLIYAALGALLAVVAIVALLHATLDVVSDAIAFREPDRVFAIMDQLLFVLMIVEILHTVRVSVRSGELNAEPFLIVGLIASIRRVLVITLESSKATKNAASAADLELVFRHSMIELAVLAML